MLPLCKGNGDIPGGLVRGASLARDSQDFERSGSGKGLVSGVKDKTELVGYRHENRWTEGQAGVISYRGKIFIKCLREPRVTAHEPESKYTTCLH